MRNAERHVAQGKIRAAISEYRAVVDNDPRDIATLNMLGDLYAKSSEKREAVECYLQVAEHYNTQGFAQKAIAVYNKISRIQPESIEVSAKLAELHKGKGSLSEARSHYTTLAEHYQNNGRRLEALAMWKQIALLDPNNTDVCLSLAESYLREGQRDDAAEAFAEAGARFSRQNKHEEAIRALMKGFDIKSTDLRILSGLIKAQTAIGRAGKAVSLLEEILDGEPYNRDVLYLLIECCIDSQNAAAAEKAVIKLVEIEPANYSKFLDLIRIYLNVNDPDSAARILSMSAEYLLAGGQSEECSKWIDEILDRSPLQLVGLRLQVRYFSWMKDEVGFRRALERLNMAAREQGSIDDERFALAQLVVLRPHETQYRERLNEINAEHGFEDIEVDEDLLKAQFTDPANEVSPDLTATVKANEPTEKNGHRPATSPVELDGIERSGDVVPAEFVADEDGSREEASYSATADEAGSSLSHSDELKLQTEIESVKFYIENDYADLAAKALTELTQEFGEHPDIAALRAEIGIESGNTNEGVPHVESALSTLGIDQIRSEFGLEDSETVDDSDYDTHYHTAVAYQEMGLLEDAIREFQDAVNLVKPNDGSRRFFQCANLLGHCFLQNGKANHAVTWIKRALETNDISDEEHHGLWYELALAYEADGDTENSALYFEQVYAENIDFRDVAERVKNLMVNH